MSIEAFLVKYFDLIWFLLGGAASVIVAVVIIIIRRLKKNYASNDDLENIGEDIKKRENNEPKKSKVAKVNTKKAVKNRANDKNKKVAISESRKFKPVGALYPTHEEKYKHHNNMNCHMYLPERIYDEMVKHVSSMSSFQGIQQVERWNDTAKYYGSVQGIREMEISFTEKPVGNEKIIILVYKITADDGKIYYYTLYECRSKGYDFISRNYSEDFPE